MKSNVKVVVIGGAHDAATDHHDFHSTLHNRTNSIRFL